MLAQEPHLRLATAAREASDAVLVSAARAAAVADRVLKSYVRLVVASTFATASAYRVVLAAYRHEFSRSLADRAARETVARDVAAPHIQRRSLELAAVRAAATNFLWRGKVACAARAAVRASAIRSWQIGRHGAHLLRAFMAAKGLGLVAGSSLGIGVGVAVGLLRA